MLPLIVPSLALLGLEPVRFLMAYATVGLIDRQGLPRGDGHPVMLFPGLGADMAALAPLANCCRGLGYDARGWGRGLNSGPQGDYGAWIDALAADVAAVGAERGRRVSLVGWSLGGIYANEIARRRPTSVRQVITLGTPAPGRGRPPVPTTSIYSRSDGVVPWRDCLGSESACMENVEVHASHAGLACHPQVWRVVADRLAQPEGRWRRYAA
jgi:pimeloyl-ACP methyl ester carboxylesterase